MPLLEEFNTKQLAFRSLLEDIAAIQGMNFTHPYPPAIKDVTLVLESVKNKLGLAIEIFEDKGSHGGSGEYLRKQIYFDEKYNFQTSEWHHKLAFLLYALRDPAEMGGIRNIVREFTDHNFGTYWEKYLKESLATYHYKPIEIINDNFWFKKRRSQKEELIKQFIEKNNKDRIPYLLANKSLPLFSSNSEFIHHQQETASLIKIVKSGSNRSLITISSRDFQQGKSTFLWNFLFKNYQAFNFIWVHDLQLTLEDLSDFKNEAAYRRVVIVIDGKLKLLEEDKKAISKLYNVIDLKYHDSEVTFLIVDSEFYFCLYESSLEDIVTECSTQRFTDFRLSVEDNEVVLGNILKYYGLDKEQKLIPIYNFTHSNAALDIRISQLLGNVKHKVSEQDFWKNDEKVLDAGLTELYTIVASLQFYGIKFPLDYTSDFFKKSSKEKIASFLSSDSAYANLIRLETKEDYPKFYLQSRKPLNISKDIQAAITVTLFVEELLTAIDRGEAENWHAYIYRKLYRNTRAISGESTLSKTLRSTNRFGLLKKIIGSSLVDPENKEKCIAEIAKQQIDLGSYADAEDTLKFFGDDNLVANYHKARSLFKQNKIPQCLERLKDVPIVHSVALLRNKCFLKPGFLEQGIEYYLANLHKESVEVLELRHLFTCFDRLIQNKDFSKLDTYYSRLEYFYANRPFKEKIYNDIRHSRATMYFKWGKNEIFDNLPPTLTKADFYKLKLHKYLPNPKIEKAKELLIDLKKEDTRSSFLVTEADIYKFTQDYVKSLDLIQNVITNNPTLVPANILIAEIYLHRPKKNKKDVEMDHEKAYQAISRNLEFLSYRAWRYEDELPTYITLSKILVAQKRYFEARNHLQLFIKQHELVDSAKDNHAQPIFYELSYVKKLIRDTH